MARRHRPERKLNGRAAHSSAMPFAVLSVYNGVSVMNGCTKSGNSNSSSSSGSGSAPCHITYQSHSMHSISSSVFITMTPKHLPWGTPDNICSKKTCMLNAMLPAYLPTIGVAFSALTPLVGWQEGHPGCKKYGGMVDGVAPSRMVGVSASVNLPLHHKVQKFYSGTGSPRWSRKKGRKTVVVAALANQAHADTSDAF